MGAWLVNAWWEVPGATCGMLLFAQNGQKAPQGLPPYLPLIAIGILFYFILMRPDMRRRAEHKKMLENLKQNDQVVTIGGIFGRVVSLDKESVVLRVDDNTRIRVLRSAISTVESDDKKSDAK